MTKLIDPTEPIAIIGLGGLFPGANDVPRYWANILGKVDSIGEIPADRWDWRLYYDPNPSAPDKTYSKIGGFVRDFKFDAIKLRIPPPVAGQMDTVQQLAVLATAEALRDSGYDKKPFDSSRAAVIFGNSMGGPKKEQSDLRVYTQAFQKHLSQAPAFAKLAAKERAAIAAEVDESFKAGLCTINEDTMPGELSNVIAGRIANTFNLNGPNFTVDAACAASLAALSQAVNGLRFHQFDMAVCGGVDQMMAAPAYVKFCKIGALSPDGSRPFDAGANGFVMGEGAGAYILKRLSDALKDGDRVYALIRAIGASSDGRGKGITAPNPKGQKLAVERVFAQVDYSPEDVGLLEAHGTSTKVGDVVEVQTAAETFKAPKGSIALGSIKSQIGHLKAAAGAAGLVKTALALHHKTLPPSINFKTPNPGIDWANSPFRVQTEVEPWKAKDGKPRRAHVSAFGFGGTNFHVALEEFEPGRTSWTPAPSAFVEPRPAAAQAQAASTAAALPESLGAEAFILRGDSPEALLRALEDLKARATQDGPLTALARSLSGRGDFVLSIAAESAPKLREKIDLVLSMKGPALWEKTPPAFKPKGIYPGRAAKARPKAAFMFPGQGSQYVDMLKDLRQKYRVVAETFAEADRIMQDIIGERLSDILFTKGGETPETLARMQERIKQTEITQPAVLTADIAILRLLAEHGLAPDVVCGHSLGEYGALVASGVLEFKDALLAVSARGKEMAGVKVKDKGKMASVAAPVDKVQAVLDRIDGYVICANKNCAIQTVIAGESKAVEKAVELFGKAGIQSQLIEVSHAFHSKIVAPGQDAYGRFLKTIAIRAPRIPVLSNVTADYFPADPAKIHALMVEQIAAPVEFIRQAERMYADGVRVFVEVGPKRALTAFLTSTLEGRKDAVVASSNHPKRGGIQEFNDLLARLAASGIEVSFDKAASLHTPEYASWSSRTAPAVPVQPVASASLPELLARWDINLNPVVVSGIGAGIPGSWDRVFRDDALDHLIEGNNCIERLPEDELRKQLGKNLERVVKSETGDHAIQKMESIEQVIRLAARAGEFDIGKEFGVRGSISSLLDDSYKLAIAAGILALKDAGIPLVRHYKRTTTGGLIPTAWGLPDRLGDHTGVIFASAFPGLDSMIEDVSRYFADKYSRKPAEQLFALVDQMIAKLKDPADRRELADWYADFRAKHPVAGEGTYHFSRSFLLRVLSLGHAQMSQFIKAHGPCTQVNAACASTTQAVGIAEDWIRLGRAKRVVIIAADNITNPVLMEWLGTGFLATGAASTHNVVSEAALPFDRRRNGMIIGMGAVGMVIEDSAEVAARGMTPLAEVLATQFENSAYHVTRLNTRHVCEVMERLVAKAEKRHGIRRSDVAAKTLFMSHETYTPAQGGSSAAEVEALKNTFGADVGKVVVTNTKGFTGHSMGASLEDVVAIRAMNTGKLPPIANYKEADPNLSGIRLSEGGDYDCEYALRLGAGFGSQVAMTLMRRTWKAPAPRVADPARHRGWLVSVSGLAAPELEVVQNTLRVKDTEKRAPRGEDDAPPARRSAEPATERSREGVPAPDAVQARPRAPLNLGEEQVKEQILALVGEKTGYPREMLELDLDMEADLGIDTVKQAELIGLIREKYAIPRQENLSLKDYPTLRHVIKFVLTGAATDRALSRGSAASEAVGAAKPMNGAHKANGHHAPVARVGGPSEEAVRKEIVALVGEKTGYPAEMLELDLDMEADLGIDTVKQAELIGLIREKYAIPRQENLSLKDYPTLRHVIKFVLTGGGSAAPAPAPVETKVPVAAGSAPAAAPVRPSAAPAPSRSAGLDEGKVRAEITALVGEKTGYPAEMLELDLDMEADLGIDTVKQAELIGLIREKYAIPRQENLSLKDYPTLRHVIKFVMAAPTASEAALPRDSARSPVAPAEDARFMRRVLVAYDRPAEGKAPALTPERPVVLLASDPEAAAPMAKAVEKAGGKAVVVRAADWQTAEKASSVLRQALKDAPAGGLVDLTPLGHGDPAKQTPAAFDKAYRASVRAAFLAAQALREDLSAPGAFALALTRLGGAHGVGGAAAHPLSGAATGLLKSLRREIPSLRAAAVDFERDASPEAMAEAALAELGSPDVRAEVGVRAGRRVALALAPKDLPEAPRRPRLSAKSVVLVTGGGLGLGAELAKEIARRYKCPIALFGRTPLSKEATAWARMSAPELKALKMSMWEELKADKTRKATPALLEKEFSKISKAAELHRNIEEMVRSGSKVVYEAADLSDAQSAAKAVQAVLKAHKNIDVVVHAAGLEESKLLADKKPEDFDRVFRAKAHGAFHLMKAVPAVGAQTWVFFSSVVARFGNIGQTDYAAANDFLAKLAWTLKAEGRGSLVFDLSAFSEIGMATRGGVEAFLKSQGVDFMPPKTGIAMMLDEIQRNSTDPEVVLSGALGALDSDGLILDSVPRASEPAAKPSVAPASDSKVVVERTFSLDSDPWLKDHSIGGVPYVAGVMGLELFAEAARKLTGKDTAALSEVRFALPVKLLRGKPVTARAEAVSAGGAVSLALKSDFVTPAGIKLGEPRVHFTARLGAGEGRWKEVRASALAAAKASAGKEAVAPAAVYSAYFHGPSFQVLAGIRALSEKESVATFREPKAPLWPEPRSLAFSPMLIEAAFQACGYRDLHYAKKMTLPDSIGSVRVSGHGERPSELSVLTRWKGATQAEDGTRSAYDAWVFDAEGRLWAELLDYRMIAVS